MSWYQLWTYDFPGSRLSATADASRRGHPLQGSASHFSPAEPDTPGSHAARALAHKHDTHPPAFPPQDSRKACLLCCLCQELWCWCWAGHEQHQYGAGRHRAAAAPWHKSYCIRYCPITAVILGRTHLTAFCCCCSLCSCIPWQTALKLICTAT